MATGFRPLDPLAVMRDLIGATELDAAERARVATEDVGARLLVMQETAGSWAGTAWNRGWERVVDRPVDTPHT